MTVTYHSPNAESHNLRFLRVRSRVKRIGNSKTHLQTDIREGFIGQILDAAD